MTFQALEHVLGTSTKVRVLRVMVTLTRPISGREAARLAGVSSKAIRALDELASVGLVTKREGTGQFLYSFNRKNILSRPLAALYQAEERRTRELTQAISDVLSTRATVLGAAIFGSTARSDTRPESDLDVIVIVSDASGEGTIYDALLATSNSLWERFGVRLSPVVLTKTRWQRQVREHDPFATAVLQEALMISGTLLFKGEPVEKRKKKTG
ncbi:MAG TPA: nucleotidyltransferase domain-containing protein [Longimicrobiales bacterium]